MEAVLESPLELDSPTWFQQSLRHFRLQVEDWHDVSRSLCAWEDAHLLDAPAAEAKTQHTLMLDKLQQLGNWLSLVSRSPDFPDHETADLIACTLQDLHDRRVLFHGNHLSREQAEAMLKTVFP